MALSLVPFDDRDGWIWMDGQFIPWRDAKVHVLTHALSLRLLRVRRRAALRRPIFELRQHTERLVRSARILDFEIPTR
jgi:branched-chain amino acid aminotransferase